MKAFFDTSVLVPIFYADHVHHAASLSRLVRFEPEAACCGAHSLAELYATLTRMPGRYRVSGEQAMLFIGSVSERLSLIALTGAEYAQCLEQAAARGVVGGAVYDALLASCALKAGAAAIYTWNTRHYPQLDPEITRRLRTP